MIPRHVRHARGTAASLCPAVRPANASATATSAAAAAAAAAAARPAERLQLVAGHLRGVTGARPLSSVAVATRSAWSTAAAAATAAATAAPRRYATSSSSAAGGSGNGSGSGSSPSVRHVKRQSARVFVLNRPEKLNSLNLDMIDNMVPQLQAWQDSELCKVIVITNDAQHRAFCAGGDIATVVKQASSGKPEEMALAVQFFEAEYKLNHLIGTCTKPVVAVMNGITFGGGVGLACHAPFRIATEKTVFAMPECGIGLFPDVGGTFLLSRLDGELGTYLGLTGQQLKGEDVVLAGIASHYVPSAKLPDLMEQLADIESDEVESVNAVCDEFATGMTAEQWSEWTLGGPIRKAIDRCFAFNAIEQIVQALEKEISRAPSSDDSVAAWAKVTLDKLTASSPTSLKVTLEMLRLARTASFADCLCTDYRAAQKFLRMPDFTNYVTATFITKTKQWAWDPAWKDMTEKLPRSLIGRLLRASPSDGASSMGVRGSSTRLAFYNDRDFYQYPHRTLSGLPFERDVRRVMEGQGRRNASLAKPETKAEIIEWFMAHWGGYDAGVVHTMNPGAQRSPAARDVTIEGGFGRGKVGLRERVVDILDRKVRTVTYEENGTTKERLQWQD